MDKKVEITQAANGYVVVSDSSSVVRGPDITTTVHTTLEGTLKAVAAYFGLDPFNVRVFDGGRVEGE